MADLREDAVARVESLLAEREALAAKEKKLVEDLNEVLVKIGYKVVALSAKAPAAAGSTGKKLGRPPGSGKASAPKG